jgi:hypothetical protein
MCTANPGVDHNIMSFYNCTDLMIDEQKTRSRATIKETSLVNSNGCLPLYQNFATPFSACHTNVISTNVAGINSVELNGITFTSFSSANDGGNIDNTSNYSNYFEIDVAVATTLNVVVFPVSF